MTHGVLVCSVSSWSRRVAPASPSGEAGRRRPAEVATGRRARCGGARGIRGCRRGPSCSRCRTGPRRRSRRSARGRRPPSARGLCGLLVDRRFHDEASFHFPRSNRWSRGGSSTDTAPAGLVPPRAMAPQGRVGKGSVIALGLLAGCGAPSPYPGGRAGKSRSEQVQAVGRRSWRTPA